MLDKRRIRLMTRMAAYEKNHISEDLKISTYYRKDYASLHTWATFLWTSIGYVILAGLYVLCNTEAILDNLNFTKFFLLGAIAAGIYLILLIIYCACANSLYKEKHNRAKQRVKRYYRDMARLEKLAAKEKK